MYPMVKYFALLWVCAVAAAADKPHVVLVVGTLHYSPELTMPVVAEELERFGFETTVVMGWERGIRRRRRRTCFPGSMR